MSATCEPGALRAQIEADLAAGRVGPARLAAEQALARWPGTLAFQLLLGTTLEKSGRMRDAAVLYADMRATHPAETRVTARHAAALARLGQGEAAMALYHSGIAMANVSEAERTRMARQIAAPLRRNKEAAALLAARVGVTPDDAALLREAGSAAASTGALAEAVEFLERSAARAALPAWAHAVKLDAQARLARRSGRLPVVDSRLLAALQAALESHPHEPAFVREFNRLPIGGADWQRLYARIRAVADPAAGDGFLRYEMALAALQADDPTLAGTLLASLAPGSDWAARAAPLLDVLRGVPAAVWRRTRLRDDKAAELQIVRVPGAAATLLVFATLTGNFMMLPLAMLDALLAPLPVNVVYLRDTTSHAPGLRGFRQFGSRVEDTVAALRGLVETLGAPRLLTLGASASGLSAIRYGARLGAERAITFGALTMLSLESGRAANRGEALSLAAIKEAQSRFGDVASELARAPGTRVAFYYGADYELDREHAARVSPLPSVTVHPVPGVDHHYAVLSVIARREFPSLLWPESVHAPATP